MPERSTITRHALTVLAGQLAVMAYGVTDTLVAGRHAEASLAALSVGSAIFISVYVALMGMLQALLPVWAELRGRQDWAGIGRSLRQALYLCALTSILGMAALQNPHVVLEWTDVPADLRAPVVDYLGVLALALPPALLFRMYSTLSQALGQPQWVTWLQISALFVKIPLSVWFTFGGAGLPAQGVVGCAWATLVVNYLQFGLAGWLLRTQALYTPLQLWHRMERPDRQQIRQFVRLGVPAALAITVEVTSFTLMALFIARQGTLAAAGHQIAATMAAVLYMVPLSFAIATSARVSYWRGANDEKRATQTVFIGFRVAALVSFALSAILFIAKETVASLYSSDPPLIRLTAGLLAWVAAYHLVDAVQTLCIFVLRCYHITLAPLLVYGCLLWGLGLGGGYWMAYQDIGGLAPMQSPTPFWAASAAALSLTAAVFSWILARALQNATFKH